MFSCIALDLSPLVGIEDSKLAEKAALTDCPNNVTAILPTGQQTVKIKLPNDHEVEFPVGVFSMTKNISSRLCTYYITVTSKSVLVITLRKTLSIAKLNKLCILKNILLNSILKFCMKFICKN